MANLHTGNIIPSANLRVGMKRGICKWKSVPGVSKGVRHTSNRCIRETTSRQTAQKAFSYYSDRAPAWWGTFIQCRRTLTLGCGPQPQLTVAIHRDPPVFLIKEILQVWLSPWMVGETGYQSDSNVNYEVDIHVFSLVYRKQV